MAQAAQQQQIAEQEPQELQPQPVEVEIPQPETSPEQRTEPEQQKPRPKPRHEVRIQTLAHERDEARSYAAKLQAELEQSRREAAEARAGKEQAERVGMTNYARSVDTEVAAAEAALRAAKEAKDEDAEIAAVKRLSKATAAQGDVDAWRDQQPKDGEQQPQQRHEPEPQRQQQPRLQPLAEPIREFMKENPWFNAVEYGDDGLPLKAQDGRFVSNPAFDEDMHDVAITEDKRIQRAIKLGDLPKNYMYSPEYFARIQQRVQTEFPDAFEDGEEQQQQQPQQRPKTPPMQQARQPVAPAQRQSQPGTPPKQNGTKMKLDGEQADFVRKLVDNGTMIYPRTHPDAGKRGQKMSYEDAYVTYAKSLASDPGSQQGR